MANTKSESPIPDSKQADCVGENGVCPAQPGLAKAELVQKPGFFVAALKDRTSLQPQKPGFCTGVLADKSDYNPLGTFKAPVKIDVMALVIRSTCPASI